MSPTAFNERFEAGLHGLLWGQWSALGVAGAGAGDDRRIVDPEALLLFTLEAARSDPRLFDEVLDWLLLNGGWIDVQRLRNLRDRDDGYPTPLLGAVASLLAEDETSAKWTRLADYSCDPATAKVPLIRVRPGESVPEFRAFDPRFHRAGYLRSPFVARKLSKPVAMQSAPCIRFRLRAFFGIGIRAEAVTWLLSHSEGHADDIARAISYSFPGVQQVLREMSASGLVQVRREGRQKRYRLDKERWGGFLDAQPQAAWINWPRLYRGLARILRHLQQPGREDLTEYVRASEFARVVASAKDDLEAAENGFHLPAQEDGSLDAHVSALERALKGLVG